MNRYLEYTLMGLGVLMFSASCLFWLAILLSLLIAAYWFLIRPMIPTWSALDTFGVVVILGLLGTGWIISSLLDRGSAPH
ncbi:hypothetical protein LCGC14_1064470 [marine sediment metagenome]|uniref:Uncharacterized protein n=1 Tax=marine sediment metagenome TaxID=412755 RepID=A0A0F9MPT9_9ZZZZ